MNILDRIMLALCTVFMSLLALLLVAVSRGVTTFSTVATTLEEFLGPINGEWEYTVAGVVLFVISLRLLFAGLGQVGGSILTLSAGKEGKINISKSALEDYVVEVASNVFGVHGASSEVKLEGENAISVRIKASIEPGINIPDTTEEIKASVAKNILAYVGAEVKDAVIIFRHIKAKDLV